MANEYRANALQAEVAVAYSANARASSIVAEVAVAYPSNARISGFYVEVVRTIADAPASNGRRRMAMIGSF